MEPRIKLGSIFAVLAALIIIGTVAYRSLEGWSWVDSIYFTTATLTTVGFGDIHPTHDVSKLFTVVFVLTGVSFVLFSLTIIAETYFTYGHYRIENRVKEVRNRIKRTRRPWKVRRY